jgi:hypothetical protein
LESTEFGRVVVDTLRRGALFPSSASVCSYPESLFFNGLCGNPVLQSYCAAALQQVRLTALVNGFDKSSFLFNLSALELVYLKRSELSDVVHGVVNNMVAESKSFQ